MLTVAVQRLHNQQLLHSRIGTPGELMAKLVVVQGQDYAGGKWGMGLRLPKSTDLEVEQAIAEKTIVRTWALRGTLHFVAAADLRWLLALIAPRIIAQNASMYRKLELDERTLARSNAALAKALDGGKQLNRTQLLASLEKSGISTKGLRAVHMLQRASLDALICQTVTVRGNPTYIELDRLKTRVKMRRSQALAELATRYFASRSPATLQDFVWWSGLSPADARAGLESIKSQLTQKSIGGQTYWLCHIVRMRSTPAPTAYFLPGYDEYLFSYKDRSDSIEPRHVKKMTAANGFLSTVMLDGKVVGTWKRTFQNGSALIETNLFDPPAPATHRMLTVAAERYGQFIGMPVVLR
jgi:DNA glycosylase AlkZ-like